MDITRDHFFVQSFEKYIAKHPDPRDLLYGTVYRYEWLGGAQCRFCLKFLPFNGYVRDALGEHGGTLHEDCANRVERYVQQLGQQGE